MAGRLVWRALAAAAVGGALVASSVVAPAGPAHATDPYRPLGGPGFALVVGTSGAKLVVSPSLTEMVCENFTIAGAVDRPGVLRAHSEPAADVDTFAANRCWAPQWGYVQHDQVGTWKIQVTGDPVGTTWPVVVTDVLFRLAGHTVDCNYDTGGAIGGTFDTATQVFVPTSSSLTLRDVTGPDCATLDLQSGDPVSLTGTWTNVPTAGDGPLSFSH